MSPTNSSKSLFLLLFTILMITAARKTVVKKGRVPNTNSENTARIVGGTPTTASAYPFIVSLQYFGGHYCGGSILRKQSPAVILTAAHCEVSTSDTVLLYADDTDGSNSDSFTSGITQVVNHEDFNGNTADGNDIALLWLSVDISSNNNVEAVTVSEGDQTDFECCTSGDALQIIGYGDDSSGGQPTDTLEFADVLYVDQTTCGDAYNTISNDMNCAAASGKDTCQGDSGGPMIKTGTLEQVGITSWGIGCADPDFPGVYAEVGYFYDWLVEQGVISVSENPSISPTKSPTKFPTNVPSKNPTQRPTMDPTVNPTEFPTKTPSKYPTQSPIPSPSPTNNPSQMPTQSPSNNPTEPSQMPTTANPTSETPQPTAVPTYVPTAIVENESMEFAAALFESGEMSEFGGMPNQNDKYYINLVLNVSNVLTAWILVITASVGVGIWLCFCYKKKQNVTILNELP